MERCTCRTRARAGPYLFRILGQRSDPNLKGERDSDNVSHRRIPACRLYAAKVRTVHARLFGELLLCPVPAGPPLNETRFGCCG
jgi:hypothetical protein